MLEYRKIDGGKASEIMRSKRMTYTTVAHDSGLSYSNVRRILKYNGDMVQLPTLHAIAKALEVKPEELITQ